MLKVGDIGEAEFVVQQTDTANALSILPGDEFPEVLATSRMIELMELASARTMRSMLREGELSVGVQINVKHNAPTPVGAVVRAVATYVAPEGKLFRFHVEAYDEFGLIGEGDHTRAIIETSRLLTGANRRKRKV